MESIIKGEHLFWQIAERRCYLKHHINAFVFVNLGLFIVNYLVLPDNMQFYYVTVAWGVLLFFHVVLVGRANNSDMGLVRELD